METDTYEVYNKYSVDVHNFNALLGHHTVSIIIRNICSMFAKAFVALYNVSNPNQKIANKFRISC